ncbi:MAG: caspase family protein [Desulfotignum sp.]|nr:caspase family protein [Desulfotignum sp.]
MGMKDKIISTISFLWAVVFLLVLPAPALPSAEKTALVIGNGAYKSIPPLTNPVNDAKDMMAALEGIGFEVILKINADRAGIRDGVRTFGDRIKRGGVGLFYYAGHGIQMDGINYIIPIGVNIKRTYDVEDQALRMNYVLAAMEEANNQLNIVILDACRDNPFRSINSFRGESAGLARMDAPTGTIVAYATAPGRKAEDGPGRNGTYTASLLKHLTRPGLSIQDMLNNTGLDVMKQTRDAQVPWTSSTPVPRFYLAGAAPGDQDLATVPQKPQQQKSFTQIAPKTETKPVLGSASARPKATVKTRLCSCEGEGYAASILILRSNYEDETVILSYPGQKKLLLFWVEDAEGRKVFLPDAEITLIDENAAGGDEVNYPIRRFGAVSCTAYFVKWWDRVNGSERGSLHTAEDVSGNNGVIKVSVEGIENSLVIPWRVLVTEYKKTKIAPAVSGMEKMVFSEGVFSAELVGGGGEDHLLEISTFDGQKFWRTVARNRKFEVKNISAGEYLLQVFHFPSDKRKGRLKPQVEHEEIIMIE